MEVCFGCDEHGSIPDTAVAFGPPDKYVAVCFGCDLFLPCRITDNGELIRVDSNSAPIIHAYGRLADNTEWHKLPESDEPYFTDG